jgi:hypothetical protein
MIISVNHRLETGLLRTRHTATLHLLPRCLDCPRSATWAYSTVRRSHLMQGPTSPMEQVAETYIRVGVKQFLWRVDNNSAPDKAEQRVTETATLRHVLVLHFLVPLSIISFVCLGNGSFFHNIVKSPECFRFTRVPTNDEVSTES